MICWQISNNYFRFTGNYSWKLALNFTQHSRAVCKCKHVSFSSSLASSLHLVLHLKSLSNIHLLFWTLENWGHWHRNTHSCTYPWPQGERQLVTVIMNPSEERAWLLLLGLPSLHCFPFFGSVHNGILPFHQTSEWTRQFWQNVQFKSSEILYLNGMQCTRLFCDIWTMWIYW